MLGKKWTDFWTHAFIIFYVPKVLGIFSNTVAVLIKDTGFIHIFLWINTCIQYRSWKLSELRRKVSNSLITYEHEPWPAHVHPDQGNLSLIPISAFSKGKRSTFTYGNGKSQGNREKNMFIASLSQFIELVVNIVHYAEILVVQRSMKIFSGIVGLGFLNQLSRSPQDRCARKMLQWTIWLTSTENMENLSKHDAQSSTLLKVQESRGYTAASRSVLLEIAYSQSLESALLQPCHLVPYLPKVFLTHFHSV